MNSFLDTSSLVKLYDPAEADAAALQQQLNQPGIIYLSVLTEVEFVSALSGKRRSNHLTVADAHILQLRFETDADTYGWIECSASVRRLSSQLLDKHSVIGLRAMDAIQLASALTVRADIQSFFTHDTRLRAAALAENLPVR